MYRAPKIRAPGKHLESEKEEKQTAKQHTQQERGKKKCNQQRSTREEIQPRKKKITKLFFLVNDKVLHVRIKM